VSVPDRNCPLPFASTAYPTLPFPFPLAPDFTCSQVIPLTLVHVQPCGAVTTTVPVRAMEGRLSSDDGETRIEQAVCVITTVAPPTLIEPVRVCPVMFWSNEKLTCPLPVPELEAMLIQSALLTACQEHPPVAVTVNTSFATPAPRVKDEGLTLYVQGDPSWLN
jgi:hypothetical protein